MIEVTEIGAVAKSFRKSGNGSEIFDSPAIEVLQIIKMPTVMYQNSLSSGDNWFE